MVPNRFPDSGTTPEFNAVDASLWFVVAVFDLERAAGRRTSILPARDRTQLRDAVDAILQRYWQGTRFGIHCDTDGLLSAGDSGVALTWMDAKAGDHVVTPRRGKPVDVNALWVNALKIGSRRNPRWQAVYEQAHAAFLARFWNAEADGLFDVVDVDGVPGTVDASIQPNQILAVGGLPMAILDAAVSRRVVDVVERALLTPMGLRTLAPGAPEYRPQYEGDPFTRDLAYHQDTVWPWLLGPFVEAWLRTRDTTGDRSAADHGEEARVRFLAPLMAHLESAGLGHVSEIFDAEAPFTPRGCPFQAWSLGELLRLQRRVLESRPDTHPSLSRALTGPTRAWAPWTPSRR